MIRLTKILTARPIFEGQFKTPWRLPQRFSARGSWHIGGTLASLTVLLLGSSACCADALDISTFTSLAHRCGPSVAALTLAAVAKTESRFETLVVSDNTTGRARTYRSQGAAVSDARALIAAGHSVDLGIMQINSANLRRLGMTVRGALEPCQAIAGAASLLSMNYLAAHGRGSEQTALRDALSMYNTGNARYGYHNGYVRRVELAARTLTSMNGLNAAERTAFNAGTRLDSAFVRGANMVATHISQPWNVWTNQLSTKTPGGRALTFNNILVF
jgi:type IV secretion system protein VirB1